MEKKRERLTGNPSDYGSRTLENEEPARTADGEPLRDRGIIDSEQSDETGSREDTT